MYRCYQFCIELFCAVLEITCSLNVGTWYATGLMSSAYYLSNLFEKECIDILGISEHWLFPSDIHFLNCIHPDYTSSGISNSSLHSSTGRNVRKGGVAFLWKRELNYKICPLSLESDRVIGVQVQKSQNEYNLFFSSLFTQLK